MEKPEPIKWLLGPKNVTPGHEAPVNIEGRCVLVPLDPEEADRHYFERRQETAEEDWRKLIGELQDRINRRFFGF